MLTSGAYRGFAAIGDQWRRTIAACQDRRDTGIQIEKSETHIGDQIRSSRDNYFDENQNQMLKDRNSANCNEHRIPKTEFFWHKNRYKKY